MVKIKQKVYKPFASTERVADLGVTGSAVPGRVKGVVGLEEVEGVIRQRQRFSQPRRAAPVVGHHKHTTD